MSATIEMICARLAALAAEPTKPKIAAMVAMTKNASPQENISVAPQVVHLDFAPYMPAVCLTAARAGLRFVVQEGEPY